MIAPAFFSLAIRQSYRLTMLSGHEDEAGSRVTALLSKLAHTPRMLLQVSRFCVLQMAGSLWR